MTDGIVRSRARILGAYGLMIVAAAGVFLFIRAIGESKKTPGVAQGIANAANTTTSAGTLAHVLLAMTVIIVVTRSAGILFRKLKQPAVIGELVGGILLGPSLLGRVAPDVTAHLLPADVAPFLNVIAQLGVILYMFLVGLELDIRTIRHTGYATLAISHASIVAPFLLGSTLALALYSSMAGTNVSFTVFALFIGVSMSVTAFPVLARILTDAGVHKTPLGTIALTCAAVDDVSAWCLLALVVSIAHRHGSDALISFVLTIAFVIAVIKLGAPLVRKWLPRIEASPGLSRSSLSVIVVAMLVSALSTEYIGIHAIFGAFLLGAIFPHDSRIAHEIKSRFEDLVTVLFLPAFFAYTGMRTQIGLIEGAQSWAICLLVIAVACAGKFGGSVLAARLSGFSWRASSALGVLMNTRGLVELIVLNIGLDLGVISPTLFAILVIMALTTTLITSPILHLIMGDVAWETGLQRPNDSATPAVPNA